MNNVGKEKRKIVGVEFGPGYLWGLVVRIVLLENGGFRTQQWDDSDGWIDSELTYGDFFEARELTPEQIRKAGLSEE